VKAPEGTRQKSGRKFAIRPATVRWPQKHFPGDCLSKTQVPAQLEKGCIGAET